MSKNHGKSGRTEIGRRLLDDEQEEVGSKKELEQHPNVYGG